MQATAPTEPNGSNGRFWHKADIPSCTAHVRFRGYSRHAACAAKVKADRLGLVRTREGDPPVIWERPTCARVELVTGNGTLKGDPCNGKPKRAWALRRWFIP